MRLECGCGRTYRAPDHDCPGCGATLQALAPDALRRHVAPGAARIDPVILVRQKLALRDELRVRDRQLRQLEARLRVLQAELDRLKRGPAASLAEPPVRILETTIRPTELPSNRTDLSLLLPAEETPALQNATLLPDDRLPLFEPED